MKYKLLVTIISLFLLGQPLLAVDITTDIADDPYYQMNSSNLNTMNSYIIPDQNDVNPQAYDEIKYSFKKDANGFLGYSIFKDTTQ